MPRLVTRLTAARVATAPPGRYGDGDGLYLFVRKATAAFWVFRYKVGGRPREMGLGRARGPNSVSLKSARDAAAPLQRLVRNRVDPLDQREAERAAARAAAQAEKARAITFRAVARLYLDAHEAKWSNTKHRGQWEATLDTYAMPHMGDLPTADVGTAHVLAALEPIWTAKPETAQRVRGRIETVLNYATTREWRSGDNPARWRGHLANLLPPRGKIAPVEHHAALPWSEIGSFMESLAQQEGVAALALRFTILTAARTGEALGALWSEISVRDAIWTVPPARMKAGKEHRVPLSAAALAILQRAAQMVTTDNGDYVFPGTRGMRPLSGMAMLMLLRRMGRGDLTAHGFRSTFRDWVAEATGYPREVAEAALAHTPGNRVEAAYRRGDLFEKRGRLMEEWAVFCARPIIQADVVPLRHRAVALTS
jgi:integrase